jgi:hypothetical protein
VKITGLSPGTLYYFKINANDTMGNTNNTITKFFVTEQRLAYFLNPPGYNQTWEQSNMNLTILVVSNDTVSNGGVNISKTQDDPTGTFPAFGTEQFYNISADQIILDNLSYAVITVNYTTPSFTESTIRIYRYNNVTGWATVSVTGDVNESINQVRATITQFSYYAVGGALDDGDACTSDSQCANNNCVTKYNSTTKICAPSGKCAKDSSYYNSSYLFCSGNNSVACKSSGTWESTSCSRGCNTTSLKCNSAGSSGSSGSSGDGGGTGNFTPIIPSSSKVILPFSATPSSPQTVSVLSTVLDIRELTLAVNSALPSGSQLEISQYDDLPTGVEPPSDEAYKYFYFSALNLPYSLIKSSEIKFRVEKA